MFLEVLGWVGLMEPGLLGKLVHLLAKKMEESFQALGIGAYFVRRDLTLSVGTCSVIYKRAYHK